MREFAGIEGARDEKYLEVETEYVKTGEEEEEGRGCFDSDTSRRRNAWLASRRARSMNQKQSQTEECGKLVNENERNRGYGLY